jgi:hypothetical protein
VEVTRPLAANMVTSLTKNNENVILSCKKTTEKENSMKERYALKSFLIKKKFKKSSKNTRNELVTTPLKLYQSMTKN